MDKSQEYIEMCRQAEEIQPGVILTWNAGKKDYPESDREWLAGDFYSQDGEPDVVDIGEDPYYARPKGVAIWLPRQDQLQEMVGHYPDNYLDFVNWNETYYPIIVFPLQKQQMHPFSHFNSMEQLWLAYVMWRKFHKVWDSEKKEWK